MLVPFKWPCVTAQVFGHPILLVHSSPCVFVAQSGLTLPVQFLRPRHTPITERRSVPIHNLGIAQVPHAYCFLKGLFTSAQCRNLKVGARHDSDFQFLIHTVCRSWQGSEPVCIPNYFTLRDVGALDQEIIW